MVVAEVTVIALVCSNCHVLVRLVMLINSFSYLQSLYLVPYVCLLFASFPWLCVVHVPMHSLQRVRKSVVGLGVVDHCCALDALAVVVHRGNHHDDTMAQYHLARTVAHVHLPERDVSYRTWCNYLYR